MIARTEGASVDGATLAFTAKLLRAVERIAPVVDLPGREVDLRLTGHLQTRNMMSRRRDDDPIARGKREVTADRVLFGQ